jgi:hypothetical protein
VEGGRRGEKSKSLREDRNSVRGEGKTEMMSTGNEKRTIKLVAQKFVLSAADY